MNLKFDEEQKRFIENYSEEQFVEFYPTYLKLVNKYSTELVDLFIDEFDCDPSYLLKFEDMYEGQFETGQDFAWHWVNEICEETKNIPSWVTAPTTVYFLPSLIPNTFFAIAPAATLDAVSRADCLPPPL